MRRTWMLLLVIAVLAIFMAVPAFAAEDAAHTDLGVCDEWTALGAQSTNGYYAITDARAEAANYHFRVPANYNAFVWVLTTKPVHICLDGQTWNVTEVKRVLRVTAGATVYIHDCSTGQVGVMNGGQGSYGGTMYVESNASVYFLGGTIQGGTATGSSYGGCVHVESNANFYMGIQGSTDTEKPCIQNGTATKGGGNVHSKGNFYIYSGCIKDGYGVNEAGNIYITSGTVNMTGGVIKDGVAGKTGGNVFLWSNSGAVFNLGTQGAASKESPAIIGGKNGYDADGNLIEYQDKPNAGSIYIASGTTFNLYSGKVVGGTSVNGGGNFYANGTLNITGGKIADGVASYAATAGLFGVGATVNISGGEADRLSNNNNTTLSGNPTLTNFRHTKADALTILANFGGTVSMVRDGNIRLGNYDNAAALFAGESPKFTTNGKFTVLKDNSVYISDTTTKFYCQCGYLKADSTRTKHAEWCSQEVLTWVPMTSSTNFTTAGNYYVPNNNFSMGGQKDTNAAHVVNVDLNGYTATSSFDNRLVRVRGGVTFNVTDTSAGDTANGTGRWETGSVTAQVAGFWLGGGTSAQWATLNLFAGTFAMRNNARIPTSQGGIVGSSGSNYNEVNMYDQVVITGGKVNSTSGGGNVHLEGGSFADGKATNVFNMYGGLISNGEQQGTSRGGGNVMLRYSAEFNMYGGTIENGTSAVQGGNVYIEHGTFTMDNGTIQGGVAEGAQGGGNVCLYQSSVDSGAKVNTAFFNMEGGTVSAGYAKSGGNIYCRDYGTVTITGGTIFGGEAYSTAVDTQGGNIYNTNYGILNIANCTIRDAVAGGGVQGKTSTTLSGTITFSNNGDYDIYVQNGHGYTVDSTFVNGGTDPIKVKFSATSGDLTKATGSLDRALELIDQLVMVDGKKIGIGNSKQLYAYTDAFGVKVEGSDISYGLGTALEIADGKVVTLNTNYGGTATVSEDALVDLNGFKLSGNITIAEGKTLKLADSSAINYVAGTGAVTANFSGEGTIARSFSTGGDLGGNYRFLVLAETTTTGEGEETVTTTTYTSHRIFLSVRNPVLYAGAEPVIGYKTALRCDPVVQKYVAGYGIYLKSGMASKCSFYDAVVDNSEGDNTKIAGVRYSEPSVAYAQGQLPGQAYIILKDDFANGAALNLSNSDDAMAQLNVEGNLNVVLSTAVVTPNLKDMVLHAENTFDAAEVTVAMKNSYKDMYDAWKTVFVDELGMQLDKISSWTKATQE